MRASTDPHPIAVNRLLASLTVRRYKELISSLRPATLEFGQVLYEPGEPNNYTIFPLTATLSVIADRGDGGRSVEVAVVGRDGMAGLPALFGHPVARYRTIAQLPGAILRAPAQLVREAANRPGPFQEAVHTYTMALIVELSRSGICNCFHTLEQRLARCILRTQDYALTDEFQMRHEFMASMLSERRVSITQTAHRLRQAGVIDYCRGRLTVIDRKALEALSCDCYRIVRESFAQVGAALSPPPRPPSRSVRN